MAPEDGAASAPPADHASDALWVGVLEAWGEERAHVAILEHAMRTRTLPELAARYRALVGDPARAAVAHQRLDAIVVAAMGLLLSTKSPHRGKIPLPITLSAAGICSFLLAWVAWAMWGHP